MPNYLFHKTINQFFKNFQFSILKYHQFQYHGQQHYYYQIFMDNFSEQSIQFLDQLNKFRILANREFNLSENPSPQNILEILLKTQVLLQQHSQVIDHKQISLENTANLLKLIGNKQKDNNSEKPKFSIKWKKQNKNQDFQIQKQPIIDKFKTNSNPFPKRQQVNNKKVKNQDNKSVEFVSANTLPKGTSLRKKFNPPYKKQEKQENKEAIGKGDDEGYDPRFKGLQNKLVQIIQSQILEKDKKITWSEIAGLGFAKKVIHEMIVWPMLRPDLFQGLRSPPKGILLFGPPGTGKTMIGRAIASQAAATFFSISASSLTSKWVGESEKLVKTLFAVARHKQPSVIFIDEIDSLLCARSEGEQESSRRVKNEFLVELDGAKTNSNERVLVIGATNLPQQLDDAVRRRFVKRLYIPLPNEEGRIQLIDTLTNNNQFRLNEEDKKQLGVITKGFSGADIYNLCSQASMIPLRQLSSIQSLRNSEVPITYLKHLKQAMSFVRPSVNKTLLATFENWNQQYGSYQLSPDQLQKNQ